MNIVVGVVGVVVFMGVARKYKLKGKRGTLSCASFCRRLLLQIQQEENYDY